MQTLHHVNRIASLQAWLMVTYGIIAALVFLTLQYRLMLDQEPPWRPEALRRYPASEALSRNGRSWFEHGKHHAPSRQSNSSAYCIVIDTYTRTIEDQQYNYLPETVGSLLGPLTEAERAHFHLIIYFKDGEQDMHWDTMSQMADSIVAGPGFQSTDMRRGVKTYPQVYKARHDHAQAMAACLEQTDAEYIIYLEDDVVVKPGWFSTFHNLIMPAVMAYSKPWLTVFLFHADDLRPQESNAINEDPKFFYGVACLSILAVALLLKLFGLPIPAWQIICSPILAVPLIALAQFEGSSAVTPLPSGLSVEWACCAQALLFSRDSAQATIDMLRADTSSTPKDLVIFSFASRENLDLPVWHPSLMQHVGVMSGSDEVEKQHRVRNWGFEMQGYDW